MITKSLFALPLLLALFATSCSKNTGVSTTALAPEVLAKVGDETITIEQFQTAAQRRRVTTDDPKARRALLDEMIRFRARVQEAKTRGYDHDPQMLSAFENMLADRVRETDQQARAGQLEVTPAEIAAYYAAHEKDFAIPAKIRAAMIFVEAPENFTQEKRAERRARIEEAREKSLTQTTPVANNNAASGFGGLAAEYSYDQTTRHRGGDLGYLLEDAVAGEIEEAVYRAAFALSEPGQISDIITTPQGFYLVKLAERMPGAVRPVSTVQSGIRQRLAREKEKEARAALAADALHGRKVEVLEERLAALPPSALLTRKGDEDSSEPPTMPSD